MKPYQTGEKKTAPQQEAPAKSKTTYTRIEEQKLALLASPLSPQVLIVHKIT
jgi:hypothetical protein